MQVEIDLKKLTLGELELAEEMYGGLIGPLMNDLTSGRPIPFKMNNIIIWLFARRQDPSLTLDDIRAMGEDLDVLLPPAPATGAAASSSGSRSSRASTTSRRKTSGD